MREHRTRIPLTLHSASKTRVNALRAGYSCYAPHTFSKILSFLPKL
jgi:hypothetical protein